jgi:hypothetical protein
MMKFTFLLWFLTKLLQSAARKNRACAEFIAKKTLVFQIQTADGMGRHFQVANGQIRSQAGLTASPGFTLTFSNAKKGFAVLSSKDGQDAFMGALRDGDLVISGDFVEVMWFQQLTQYLQPHPSVS